ncbi:MAG TPA: hypothetical protein PLV83_05350, partial [Bacilli bacterium]|nr:hypothetical protein [Bacilli bacterium]
MLKVCTVNSQNKYKINNYNGIDLKNNDNILKLYNMLENNNVNIAGTQELTSRCLKRLKEFCLPKYKIVGKYRLGNNILTNINEINKFNET